MVSRRVLVGCADGLVTQYLVRLMYVSVDNVGLLSLFPLQNTQLTRISAKLGKLSEEDLDFVTSEKAKRFLRKLPDNISTMPLVLSHISLKTGETGVLSNRKSVTKCPIFFYMPPIESF